MKNMINTLVKEQQSWWKLLMQIILQPHLYLQSKQTNKTPPKYIVSWSDRLLAQWTGLLVPSGTTPTHHSPPLSFTAFSLRHCHTLLDTTIQALWWQFRNFPGGIFYFLLPDLGLLEQMMRCCSICVPFIPHKHHRHVFQLSKSKGTR